MQASKKPRILMDFRLFYTFAVPTCKEKRIWQAPNPKTQKEKTLISQGFLLARPAGFEPTIEKQLRLIAVFIPFPEA